LHQTCLKLWGKPVFTLPKRLAASIRKVVEGKPNTLEKSFYIKHVGYDRHSAKVIEKNELFGGGIFGIVRS